MINTLFLAINPIAFEIGKIQVRWYGIILTSAMVVGLFLLIFMGKKKGISSDDALELFLWLVPLSVVMCRVIYVIANDHIYGYFPIASWDDFVNVIAIWDGGITIYGAIVGGIAGILLWCKKRKISPAIVFDICVPALLLGQSIGRWGNFCNQEAYGQLVTNPSLFGLPWSVYIDAKQNWFQATFLYESVINLIGFVLFMLLWKKTKVSGVSVFFYIAWYCTVRLVLDFLRVDGLLSTKIACGIGIPLGLTLGILYYVKGLKKIKHEQVKTEIDNLLKEEF